MASALEIARLPRYPILLQTVQLWTSSFADGPVHITDPDTRVELMEDVEVNFDPPAADAASPFHLGVFAAIIIEVPRVVVDLRGHTLRMHPSFQARQRFFSLLELDCTPFPTGKAKFTTAPKSPSDLTVRNGTLAHSSHFAIHAAVAGNRLLFEDLQMLEFEVGAISLSGCNDLTVRRCAIGRPGRPVTTTEFVFLRDLARSARSVGATASAKKIDVLAHRERQKTLPSSDALVRCIVVVPKFNVGEVPSEVRHGLERITLQDLSFEEVHAEPIEVIGMRLTGQTGPLKDVNGNLIAHADGQAPGLLAQSQAAVTPELPPTVRDALLASRPPANVEPVRHLDRRGHQLRQKANLFVRVDGANHLLVQNVRTGRVVSQGAAAASVGVMVNCCEHVTIRNVHIRGVEINAQCAPALSDDRPESGVYVRACKHVRMTGLHYHSDDACACVIQNSEHVSLSSSGVERAPVVARGCRHVALI